MKDGFCNKCKECYKKDSRANYKNNKRERIEKQKKYKENHKEDIRKYQKQYRKENVVYYKQYGDQYRKNNKEYIKQCKDRWYKENRNLTYSKRKEYFVNYHQRNKHNRKRYDSSSVLYNSDLKIRMEIELYEEVAESSNGNLMCKCAYCGEWFEPTRLQIQSRINAIKKTCGTENRLYCSQSCKTSCPIYNQNKWPKGYKPSTSREVQPELRQLVFERDNYICQKCNKHKDNLEVGIHCHHKEGILWEPLQSADMDMCITLCEDCHKEVHGIDGCGYY